MKNLIILLSLSVYWTIVSSNPMILEPRIQKLPNGKAHVMSTLPYSQQSVIIQQLRSLCLQRPNGVGDQWTLGLKRSILRQISSDGESTDLKLIKKYLTDSIVNEAVSNCDKMNSKNLKQDNSDIFEGLQAILTNVFSGNLFGIIESSVGIRSPESVRTMMSDIMRNLLENIGSAQQAISSGTSNANLNNLNIGGGIGAGLRPAAGSGTAAATGTGTRTGAIGTGTTGIRTGTTGTGGNYYTGTNTITNANRIG